MEHEVDKRSGCRGRHDHVNKNGKQIDGDRHEVQESAGDKRFDQEVECQKGLNVQSSIQDLAKYQA